jgi:hypothetical protein
MAIRDDFTEADAQKVVDAFKASSLVSFLPTFKDFADLVMAHIRQTTKLRADAASTRARSHVAMGTMAAGQATMSGTATVAQAQNNPPVWQTIPEIIFAQGTAATFSVAGLVSDAEGDTITITHNGVSLTSGVTFDSANKRFSYDGIGAAGSTSGHQLSADDNADDTIVQFGLNSTTTATAKPFCFLHSFKKGDVPAGRDVVANIPDFQATVLNRWSDGSVKHALIAGHLDLTANVTRFIDLKAGTANLGTALTEAQLLTTGITNDTFQLGSIGTVSLSNVLGRSSSGKGVAGLLRTRISGPEMSEFHYYAPVGSDNHLALFFYIRYFKNGAIEIEVSTENGWTMVANPTVKTYAPTYTIGGSNRTSGLGTLSHYALTRWGNWYYRGTDPNVRPVHDMAYYRAAGIVPNYKYTSPHSSVLTGYVTTNVPFALGDWPAFFPGTGDQPHIGLLPKWEALHCTSANINTYLATVYNSYGLGRYRTILRDETTMYPVRFTDRPTLVYSESGWSSSQVTPAITGGTNPNSELDDAHQPSWCYLAYILTGRWTFMEGLQFVVNWNWGWNSQANRQQASGLLLTHVMQTRGAGWATRALAQCVSVTPDGDVMQADYVASFAANMAYYVTNYVGSANTLGVPKQLNNYSEGAGFTTWAPWQDDFYTQSLGWAQAMDLPLSSTAKANLDTFMAWKGRSPAGRVGTVGTGQYCYRHSSQYNLRFSDTEGHSTLALYNAAVYADWGVVFTKNIGVNNDCQANANIITQMGPVAYAMNMFPALSAAVDANVPNALAGYNRFIAAPNFIALTATGSGENFHNDPRYAIGPRSV